ncbi:Zn-dependent hydrolase [Lutibacter sp. B2]|nr:Zn-dependent hydrolase [Lutibacter sp. B2]
MNANYDRIKKDIEEFRKYTSTPDRGCTRFPYTKEDFDARNYIINEMKKIGLNIHIDAIGNIRARLDGKDANAPVVMTGSHLDTVFQGGIFDGIAGVVCGLEAMRIFVENNIETNNPVELVVFVGEEGCDFDSPYIGSKVMTGRLGIEDLKNIKNKDGNSVYDAAVDFGLNPEELSKDVISSTDIKAMIELHVEQSLVLDYENIPIGIVKGIAGLKRLEIELEGVANHSGATPMHLRQDPMVTAAEIICFVNNIVGQEGSTSTVGTVGRIECIPNLVNAIAGKVTFTIDIRDIDEEVIERVTKLIIKKIKEVSKFHNVKSEIHNIGSGTPMKLSNSIIKTIEQVAISKNIKTKLMNSGAGHDACMFKDVTDVGMIFVPSVNGRSHVPEEFTRYEDLQLGCEVLFETIVKLAKQ